MVLVAVSETGAECCDISTCVYHFYITIVKCESISGYSLFIIINLFSTETALFKRWGVSHRDSCRGYRDTVRMDIAGFATR